MNKQLKFSDVEVAVRCVCPHCEKSVVAIVIDIYTAVGSSWGVHAVDEVELDTECPECSGYFDIDMLN